MAHLDTQNQDLNLVLSSDAKPRLKWTPELHQRFVDAVAQLGGPEKATPKSLMRVMGIQGLTLYHLKSHLQKYRLGKTQQSPDCSENIQQEFAEDPRSDLTSIDYNDESLNQINESLKIAQALQMQMEVQKKLHEQIEVQRHLQLRIEAQGKYLQSVLRKAQDTLAGYNSSAIEVEVAKAELSQLASMVDNGCPSSLSILTELEESSLKKDIKENPKIVAVGSSFPDKNRKIVAVGSSFPDKNQKIVAVGSSLESSLTSSESSGRKEDEDDDHHVVLPLMEMSGISHFGSGRKRSGSQGQGQRSKKGKKRFDLNSQYVNEFDFDFESKSGSRSRSNTLDLNFK